MWREGGRAGVVRTLFINPKIDERMLNTSWQNRLDTQTSMGGGFEAGDKTCTSYLISSVYLE